MTKRIRKSSYSTGEYYHGRHRFEHWFVSNQVYFITARCRGKYPAFDTAGAKKVFWDRLEHYTRKCLFEVWVVSLMSNHYHLLGYAQEGTVLRTMMQRLHGSVAKLVNDLLPERRVPFWTEKGAGHADYFDGCIRDEKQLRRAFRYTLTQSVRHGICRDWKTFPGTRVSVEMQESLRRANALGAFMEEVPYPRYQRSRGSKRGGN